MAKPELFEIQGETAVGILPDIIIQWDDLAACYLMTVNLEGKIWVLELDSDKIAFI
ncbi:MAG: hypothetical protein PHG00_16960 [Methylococcales bacterium]|nr:hypothetical protein [Methylococcales bacterium]